MLPRQEMPEYRADLASVHVEFPSLDAADTARHVEFMDELMQYLDVEADVFDPADLTFLRSAQVSEQKFWIWEFYDPMGEHCYATVSEGPRGGTSVSYDTSEGLTPEQFMLAEYHACY